MDTRQLGATGQESSIVTFGSFLLDFLSQEGANQAVELALDHGVNHVDVAPSYGDAELKLGPKLREHREDLFVGCKTHERTYEGAWRELERSLDRLGVDSIDLYQFHGLEYGEDLDRILDGDDGALAAFREARASGLIDHVGLTSHGHPNLILDAIDRIDDLETVMFPMNATVGGSEDPDHDYGRVLERCERDGLGALGIKAFAKRPWPPTEELRPDERPYGTWYEPYDTQPAIDDCLRFALSQGMTSITNAGDPKLLPMILDAAERFEELSAAEQDAIAAGRDGEKSPVPARLD